MEITKPLTRAYKTLVGGFKLLRDIIESAYAVVEEDKGICERSYTQDGNLEKSIEKSNYSDLIIVKQKMPDGSYETRVDKSPLPKNQTWNVANLSLAPSPKNNNLKPHYNNPNTKH